MMILNRYGHVILSLADDGSEVLLKKGEAVKVIRASEKRGYLVVEHKNSTIHLPFQVMELKVRSLCMLLLLRNVSRSRSGCRRGNLVSLSRGFTCVLQFACDPPLTRSGKLESRCTV